MELSRQSSHLSTTLKSAFQSHLHTYLYPHSTITVQVSVLSADGSLLAAAINACTLALVDAGIPMPGLLCGCTAGMSGSASTPQDHTTQGEETLDPILDLSLPEEQELPFITVGTTTELPMGVAIETAKRKRGNNRNNEDEDMDEEGEISQSDDDPKVSLLHMESRAHVSYLDTMLAVGVDGCKQVREILEGVVKGSSMVVPTAAGDNEDDEDDDEDEEDGDIDVDEIMESV
jgi:exosome complex component RRP41